MAKFIGGIRYGKAIQSYYKISLSLEYKQYQAADVLVFSQEGGADYLADRGWYTDQGGKLIREKVHYINNGVDLNDFDVFRANNILEDEDLQNDAFKKIIYIGSIRYANNLASLIDAAKQLQIFEDVKFLVYGDGDDRSKLEQRLKDEKITNVIFKQNGLLLNMYLIFCPKVISIF